MLIKGRLNNFMHSLTDYLERRSDLIKHYPPGTLLWGTTRWYRIFSEGVNVFFYLTKDVSVGFSGGVVLYGELLRPEQLGVRYWPEGEWKVLLPIKVIRLARGVRENPREPNKWSVVTYDTLKEIGVKILPSQGQAISEEVAKKILQYLS